MKTTVNIYTFREAFNRMGRGDQFSYEGLAVLFDYLEQFEDEYELDVIALCCEFAEDDIYGIAESYGLWLNGSVSEKSLPEDVLIIRQYLEDNGYLVGECENGSFVYRQH
jgi:hypothetical protein